MLSPVSPALAATLAVLYGGGFADNLGVQGTLRHDGAPGALRAFRLEAGVGYTRYFTANAGIGVELPIGGARGEAPASLVLAAGWAVDSDAAGGARTTVHNLLVRVGLEARLAGRWYVAAELSPVRFPLLMRASRDGASWSVPVDATDALLFRPGVGVGLRF